MTELVNQEISKELGFELKFEDKQLILIPSFDSKGVDVKMEIKVSAEYFLDQLAAAIPGQIDNTVIDLLKAAI